MEEGMLGEIRMFAGNFAPLNWEFCYGQTLQITGNEALYSLLGTAYGGNGTTTFGLPDLRSRSPKGAYNGPVPGLTSLYIGQMSGTEQIYVDVDNLPSHTHPLMGTNDGGNTSSPSNAIAADTSGLDREYNNDPTGLTEMSPLAIGDTGNNDPIHYLTPALGINFIICVDGYYPQRH